MRDPARLDLQAGRLFERRFETLKQPVPDRAAPGKPRPAPVGKFGTDWPLRLRATEAIEPVGVRPMLAPFQYGPRSGGNSTSSRRRVLWGGFQLVGSEGEALEVVVNASVLRIVRIHEGFQSSDHFVPNFGC